VDDEIDRKRSKSSKGRNKRNNGSSSGNAQADYIKLPYQSEPLLDKMNVLAKSIVSNFGVRKKGSMKFRKALDQRATRRALELKEQAAEEERKRKLQEEGEEEEEDTYDDSYDEEYDEKDNVGEDGGEEEFYEEVEEEEERLPKMRFDMNLMLKLK